MAYAPALGNSGNAGLRRPQSQKSTVLFILQWCCNSLVEQENRGWRAVTARHRRLRWASAQTSAHQQSRNRLQALPITMPAAKTSAPPRTTWKIARLHGVSIQWFWIQAMAQSSTKTTAIATVVAMLKSGIR